MVSYTKGCIGRLDEQWTTFYVKLDGPVHDFHVPVYYPGMNNKFFKIIWQVLQSHL